MKNWILFIILTITLGLFALILSSQYKLEKVKTEKQLPPSPEARKNPYLASQLFLESLGHETSTNQIPLDFSKTNTSETILITNISRTLYTPKKINNSLRWINNGGTLIIGSQDDIDSENHHLLMYFDIDKTYKQDTDKNKEETIQEKVNNNIIINEESISRTVPKYLKISNGQKFEVLSSTRTILTHDILNDYEKTKNHQTTSKQNVVNNDQKITILSPIDDLSVYYSINYYGTMEDSITLLQINYGKGSLIVLADISMWQNTRISDGDHAWLLAWLLPQNNKVHFYFDYKSPSLLSIISGIFPETLLATMLLLILWLWHKSIRTENIQKQHEETPRQIAKHLLASAKYLTVNKQYHALIDPLEDDINQRMKLTHPKFQQLGIDEKSKLLSQHTQIEDDVILYWYTSLEKIQTRNQLIKAIKFAYEIRKKL